MAHISYLIASAIRDKLQTELIDNIPSGDVSRLDIVKLGRLYQKNPLKATNNLWAVVVPGSVTTEEIWDGPLSLGNADNVGFDMPVYEIGGSSSWWRRGTVQFGFFFVKSSMDEAAALDTATKILGRIEKAVGATYIANLTDEFGEQGIKVFVAQTSFQESGGEREKTFIFRGRLIYQALTERS